MPDERFPLVLSVLADWAAPGSPTKDVNVWQFLNDTADITDRYTYFELDRVTTSLAAYLLNGVNLKRGDRALLVFFPGLSFTVSLLACFKAGIIAVPVFPPDPRKLQKDLHHFISIQQSSGAMVALTHGAYDFAKKVAGIKNIFSSSSSSSGGSGRGMTWPELKWANVDDIINRSKAKANSGGVAPTLPPPPVGTDIAFLQYTSGSTSEPKGVMISHNNLAHNLTLIIRELKADNTTHCVSWLPQYHDMGLIGSYLGTLYCGGSGFYLSPISFLKDPIVWLVAMSRYNATHTQAPNFAYALVSRKFKQASAAVKNSLDLSSLKHMINAAEPVDHKAIHNFYETLAPFKLPKGVIFPTYGLAEHTVFVCSGGKHVLSVKKSDLESKRNVNVVSSGLLEDREFSVTKSERGEEGDGLVEGNGHIGDIQSIVGCGYPDRGEGISVIIVDDDTKEQLGNDKVGEIWVTSQSKAQGYWGKPEVSAEDFHAQLKQGTASSSDGYLRTGDLGFMHDGELFICGRLKDLIIVRGTNHYPQDIERTAEACSSSIRPGCSAAFSIVDKEHGTENVVFLAEIKEDISSSTFPLIVDQCREAINTEHGVSVSSICLLKTRTIPKTTSGKIARAWCRRAFLEKTLSVVFRWDGKESGVPSGGVGGKADGKEDKKKGEREQHQRQQQQQQQRSDGDGGRDGEVEMPLIMDEATHLSVAEVRSMTIPDLRQKLETTLILVSSQGPSPLSAPLDNSVPLISLGLDSFTIVQFKGVLEKRYHCDLPDAFLFTSLATINSLAVAVQHGSLTDEQKAAFESGMVADEGAEGGGNTTIIVQKEPLCPWFTCCY